MVLGRYDVIRQIKHPCATFARSSAIYKHFINVQERFMIYLSYIPVHKKT